MTHITSSITGIFLKKYNDHIIKSFDYDVDKGVVREGQSRKERLRTSRMEAKQERVQIAKQREVLPSVYMNSVHIST